MGAHAKQAAVGKNALTLLKEEHAEIGQIFKNFRKLVDSGAHAAERMALVKQAFDALAIHTGIEEEIFYPALRRATGRNALMDEAKVEHDDAMELISRLRDMLPGEAHFDAKFMVLGERVMRHIEKEEKEIFPLARKCGIDLDRLGNEMDLRRMDLEAEMGLLLAHLGARHDVSPTEVKAALTEEGLLP